MTPACPHTFPIFALRAKKKKKIAPSHRREFSEGKFINQRRANFFTGLTLTGAGHMDDVFGNPPNRKKNINKGICRKHVLKCELKMNRRKVTIRVSGACGIEFFTNMTLKTRGGSYFITFIKFGLSD